MAIDFKDTVSEYKPQKSDIEQADAYGYQAEKADVTPQATVEDRITGLLSKDSPYLTAAGTRGEQQAAQRGLLSSSIGIEAAQKSAIESALPIAQQDASTYAEKAWRDQAAINQARDVTSGRMTDVSVSNVGELNQLVGQQQELYGQNVLTAQKGGIESRISEQEASQARALAAQQAAAAERAAQQRHEQEMLLAQQQNQAAAEAMAAEYGYRQSAAEYDSKVQGALMNIDANIREQLMAQEQGNAVELESLKQEYEIMKNLDSTMGTMYDGALRSLATVLKDPDMSAEQSTSATNVILDSLNSGLRFVSGVNGTGGSGAGGFADFDTGLGGVRYNETMSREEIESIAREAAGTSAKSIDPNDPLNWRTGSGDAG